MLCVKCKKEIQDGSVFCNWCGKKQTVQQRKSRKRANAQGSVYKLSGNRSRPWCAVLPAQYDLEGNQKRLILGYYASKTEGLNALNAAISRNLVSSRVDMTIEQCYKEWSETAFRELSQKRISSYETSYKYISSLKNKRIADTRSNDIQKIVNELAQTVPARSIEIKLLYGKLCKYAMSLDIIYQDYSKFVKVPSYEHRQKRIFTKEEINKVDNFAKSGNETAMAIMIMIYTGLRVSEFLEMKHDNVNLDEGYMIGGNKTAAGKNRIIPIHSRIYPYVDYFYQLNEETLYRPEKRKPISACHFTTYIFEKYLSSIGIEGLTPHSTRHTHATMAQEAGIASEDIIKIMGHSDYKITTETYIHQSVEKLKESIEKIR